MASTVQVLLKALGIDIDPAELMRVAGEAQQIVANFDARLARIEAQQERILELLTRYLPEPLPDPPLLLTAPNGRAEAPP